MKITILVENNKINNNLKAKHGLSLFVETKSQRILFDLGPDDTFIKNARKLNIDLKTIDTLFISHGHSDHGGGLKYFLKENNTAKIYIHKDAFKKHYAVILKYLKINVGLDERLMNNSQIILTDGLFKINDELTLVSKIKPTTLVPLGNSSLFEQNGDKLLNDTFSHEQHLLISENEQNFLLTACSHTGIINILRDVEQQTNKKIHKIVGGLHLYNPINKKTESLDYINDLANELSQQHINIYTCHCTGSKAFNVLKQHENLHIELIHAGSVIEL